MLGIHDAVPENIQNPLFKLTQKQKAVKTQDRKRHLLAQDNTNSSGEAEFLELRRIMTSYILSPASEVLLRVSMRMTCSRGCIQSGDMHRRSSSLKVAVSCGLPKIEIVQHEDLIIVLHLLGDEAPSLIESFLGDA